MEKKLRDLIARMMVSEWMSCYFRDKWNKVIYRDISEHAIGYCMNYPYFWRGYKFGSNVRIATSIYLYTLIGTTKEASIGCSPKELVLSTAVDKVTYPKDILNDVISLENNLWYIYNKTGKWHFDVEVNMRDYI